MKIAVYGRNFDKSDMNTVSGFFKYMEEASVPYIIESSYLHQLEKHFSLKPHAAYGSADEFLSQKADYLVSLGGDGTLLDVLAYVKNTDIPVMGINLGRLGFLFRPGTDYVRRGSHRAICLHVFVPYRTGH